MISNKQIEEMAKVIYASDILCHTCGESTYTYCADAIAELLYNAGYRKASEVAREIFAEIAKITSLTHLWNEPIMYAKIDFEELKELKNKYTEEGK